MKIKTLLFLLASVLFSWGLQAQCSPTFLCIEPEPNDPEIELIISPFTPPGICGEEVQVLAIINNNSNPTNGGVPVKLGYFDLCLDETGEDHLILTGVTGPWTINAGQGTGQANLSYTGGPFQPQTSIPLIFTVRATCELWSEVFAGDPNNELINNQISIHSWFTYQINGNTSLPICLEEKSAPFEIPYTLVRLDDCGTVNTTLQEGLTIAMEVTGDQCLDAFTVDVEVGPGFDLSGVTGETTVIFGPDCGAQTYDPVPALVTDNGDGTLSVILTPPPGLQFCEDDFACGMGELQLTLYGIQQVDCSSLLPFPVTFSTQTCLDTGSDPSCLENGEPIPQSETTCQVFEYPGNPDLDISWAPLPGSGLDFCGGTAILRYTITNNGPDPAFAVQVSLEHYPWMTLHTFQINGNFGVCLPGNPINSPCFSDELDDFNTIFSSTGIDVATHPTPNQLSFDFANSSGNAFGLTDEDGDGLFGELAPGASFYIDVRVASGCPFSSDSCPSVLPLTDLLTGTVSWNDACQSLDPPASSLVNQEIAAIPGDPPSLNVGGCGTSLDLTDGDVFPLSITIPPWVAFNGFGSPFELGGLTTQVLLNGGGGLILPGSVTINGQVVNTSVHPGGGVIATFPTGTSVPPLNGEITIAFDLAMDCSQADGNLAQFEYEVFGTWDACGEACPILFACGNVDFYPFCDCYPGDEPQWSCDCTDVSTTGFKVVRTNVPDNIPNSAVNHCRAYECDPVKMTIDGVLTVPADGDVGVVYGWVSMELLEMEDIFQFESANLRIGTNIYPMTMLTGSGNNPALTPPEVYGFETLPIILPTGGVPYDVNVRVVITATVREAAMEELDPGAYLIPDFRGFLSTSPGQWCVAPYTSTVFQLLRVITYAQIATTPAGCEIDPMVIQVDLGYQGGVPGEDFPGEYRPISEWYDTFILGIGSPPVAYDLTAINNIPYFTTPGNQFQLWVPSLLGTYLPPAADKTEWNGISQQLLFTLEGPAGCALDALPWLVSGRYERDIFAPGTECLDNRQLYQQGFFPESNAPPPPAVALNAQVNACSQEPLSVYLGGTQFLEGPVWIEFSFPEGNLDILPANGFISSGSLTTNGQTYLWFQLTENFQSTGQILFFHYQVTGCEPDVFDVNFTIGDPCQAPGPGERPFRKFASCFSDGTFHFDLTTCEPILRLVLEQCNQPAAPCDQVWYSAMIENPGTIDVEALILQLEFQTGLDILEAYLDSPYDGPDINCATTGEPIIPATQLTNGLNFGTLPGIQAPDAERRLHLYFSVAGVCDELVFGSDGMTLTATGQNACGEEVVRSESDELGIWNGIDPAQMEAEMAFTSWDYEQCGSPITAIATLQIDWLTILPGQTAELAFTTSPGVTVTSYSPITFANPETILIEFEYTGNCADVTIIADLVTYIEIDCNGDLCLAESAVITSATLPLNPLTISDIVIPPDLCDIAGSETTTISVVIENPVPGVPGGPALYVSLSWDEDCDGDVDMSLGISSAVTTTPPPGGSIQVDFDVSGVTLENLSAGCFFAQVTVAPSPSDCPCFQTAASELIECSCPEWELVITGQNFGQYGLQFVRSDGNGDAGFQEATVSVNGGAPFTVTDPVSVVSITDTPPFDLCFEVTSTEPLADNPCTFNDCQAFPECSLVVNFDGQPKENDPYLWFFTSIWVGNFQNPSFNWTVNGQPAGNGATLLYNFGTAGTYEVCLTVSGFYLEQLCEETFCEQITVSADGGLQVAGESPATLPVPVNAQEFISELKLYPNPARQMVNVVLPDLDGGVVGVFDLSGRPVYLLDLTKQPDTDRVLRISADQWPKGIYLLRYQNDTQVQTLRFIVQ